MVQSEVITRIHAREVLDSRGNPTVEVEVHCRGGAWGRAIVPAGASTGRHEAVELRDVYPVRYSGKGVRRAAANVHEQIAPPVIGLSAGDQRLIDRTLCELDGTPDKARLGANAILGVSLACAHAAAACRRQPLWQYLAQHGRATLPLPMVNMISGGLHAGGNLDFQDFLLLPVGARSYSEALEMAVAVYRSLATTLMKHGVEGVLVGDEGGFGPALQNNEQAIELILEAIAKAGLTPGRQAALAVDAASTQFYHDGKYLLRTRDQTDGAEFSAEQMIELVQRWVETYPILSIEDGLAEDDWDGWKKLTAALGSRVQLIGDDLFVTNPDRLRRGIAEGVANSVLVKVNQIGTLTETLDAIELAKENRYTAVISHRSGETEDTTIADIAVATNAGQIKTGSLCRTDRVAKYNQLLRIEEELGDNAIYGGKMR